MGRPAVLGDDRLRTPVDGAENVDVIDQVVGDWIASRRKLDVTEILNNEQIPCAPVQTMQEVAEDPHLLDRGAFVDVAHPEQGTVRLPIPAIRLHGADPMSIETMAPPLAAQTASVLQELLGKNERDIEELVKSGAIAIQAE